VSLLFFASRFEQCKRLRKTKEKAKIETKNSKNEVRYGKTLMAQSNDLSNLSKIF